MAKKGSANLCDEHINYYLQNIDLGSDWALSMYDASTKLADGILMNNLPQIGNFDECINSKTEHFTGQYCRLQLNVTTLDNLYSKSVGWSVCAPSTCNDTGVAKVSEIIMNNLLNPLNFNAKIVKVFKETCFYQNHPTSEFQPGFWVAMAIIAMIICIVLCATVLETLEHTNISAQLQGYTLLEKTKKKDFLYCFSLYRNMKELWSTKMSNSVGNLACLNGMRALSLAWVIIGHRYAMDYGIPIINYNVAYEEFRYNWKIMPITNAFVCVDSFLFLGGLLTSYVMMKQFSKGVVIDPFKYYLYRYLRLTPPLFMLMIIIAGPMYYISNGPLWSWQVGSLVQSCHKNWWLTLLYINNYVNQYEMCVNHSWYVSIDMQLAIATPIIFLALVRWEKLTVACLCIITLSLCFWTFGLTYTGHYPWTLPFTKIEKINRNFAFDIYIKTEHRASPYIVGFIAGYIISKISQRKDFSLKKRWIYLGWTTSTLGALAIIYTAAIAYSRNYQYNPLDAAFYGGFHRAAWAICLSWVVFACVFGYGGVANKILSWSGWLPFTRLSYCGFLVHYPIMYILNGMVRNPEAYSNFRSVHHFFSDVFITTFMASILYLTVEAPTNNLLKMAFKKETVENKENHNLLSKNENEKKIHQC